MPARRPADDPAAGLTGDAVIHVARRTYGRLIAYLSARTRDIAACEDALSAAFESALKTWPDRGVPENPEAWLLTAARNRLRDTWRRDAVRQKGESELLALMEQAETMTTDTVFPDERLKLMLVCTHPAIDEAVRTPLMLQAVLGLSAERIASAFLVKPGAMGQRLSRAKTKIRDAGIAFAVPESDAWAERLPPLLAAIYAAYALGWGDHAGGDAPGGLADEALELGFALYGLVGLTPELNGLLALILYCEARKAARFRDGAYVALSEQDPARWDWAMIDGANRLLKATEAARPFGRYQLEAAIQSVHARRGLTGATAWGEIVVLYDALLRTAPSMGGQVARAAALCEAGEEAAALAALDGMDVQRMLDYQPWWATRAHVLARLEQPEAARQAYSRAIGLSQHASQRDFLRRRQALL